MTQSLPRASWRALTTLGTGLAIAGTVHTAWNLTRLRVPPSHPPTVREPVSVLLPVRDEAGHVAVCLSALLAQTGVRDLEVLVLDDGSTDGTADVVRALADGDQRVRLLEGCALPGGWLGKPHACQQLADAARGRVLVFIDADVVLQPHAVASTIALLRRTGLDLVSPYPRQVADTAAERLVQPLLQWSWLTTLPLRSAERSPRPSLAAANGQLLAVDSEAYRAAGGHEAVRTEVLEDIALLRAFKRAGRHGTVVDGTAIATCHMYERWDELRDGYTKSLWSAFGSPLGAAAAVGALGVAYVVPAAAALRGSRTGLIGFVAGTAGRALIARRVGGRIWPDSATHPLSIIMLGYLTARSWRSRRNGTLRWKGRVLP